MIKVNTMYLMAIYRSGSPIGNHVQHITMVHNGGIYHTKNKNNIRRVYLRQCRPQVPYHCAYKRMHLLGMLYKAC